MRPLPMLTSAFLACLFAGSVLARPAEPLGWSEIAALGRIGLDEEAILELAEARGLEGDFGVEEATLLRDAGLPMSLISELVRLHASPDVEIRDEDGVMVVSGRGTSEGEPAVLTSEPLPDDDTASETSTSASSHASDDPLDLLAPHPSGAVVGWNSSVLFLPAHYGANPSSFGRTVVIAGGTPGGSSCAAPCAAPCTDRENGNAHTSSRMITIRTSRGLIRVPN